MAAATSPAPLPIAEPVDCAEPRPFVPIVIPLERSAPARGNRIGAVVATIFGSASLFLGLAVLASLPLLQFLTLGYLLEASGRIARTGRLRDGFVGVRLGARLGGMALGAFVLWLPLYGMSYLADRARIIDPDGRLARRWDAWLVFLTVVYVVQVVGAFLRGGRLRWFLWPLTIPWLVRRALHVNVLREARDAVWHLTVQLRLPYYFWLGLRGFLGALLWLLVPAALLAQGHRYPALGVLGGVLLGLVVLYLPFLQTRFARDNRLRAFIQVQAVRRDFRRAPFAFALALTVHLLFATPLYLLKIEMIPGDLMYLEGMVFLAFIFPARLLDGWAYARGARKGRARLWLFRWLCRFAVLPVAAAYVVAVFLSPHLGWNGIASLFEQHAFLLPTAFT